MRRDLLIKGYVPLPAQKRFHNSRAKFRAYVGGYGSGKTYAACHEATWLSYLNRGLAGMLIAPTYRMIEDATLATLLEILDGAGIGYRYRSSSDVLHLPWGSKILLRSAENPGRLKGPNLSWVGIDEGALIAREAWDVAISRVRHPQAIRPAVFVVSTPEGYNWLYEEFSEKRRRGYTLVRAATAENFHLPPDYAADLVDAYGPELSRQYVMGEFVSPTSGRVYQGFDRDMHVVAGLCYEPALPLVLCVDFNVSPLCAALAQVVGGVARVFDEVALTSSNTYELCGEVISRYPEARVIAYPDPSGRARKTAASSEAPSDFAILAQHGFEVRARPKAPAVKDRVNAVNRRLVLPSGDAGVVVSPLCREAIRSFERTSYKPGSSVVDKSAGTEHMSDAIGYFIEYEYPIRAPQRVEYAGLGRRGTDRGY